MGYIIDTITNKMKFSTTVVTLAFLICAVRCGVILDRLKKVRCDLHHMGDSVISHAHLISDPCPHEQAVTADENTSKYYDNGRQDVGTQTAKHESAADYLKHEDDSHSLYMPESSTKHDRYDQKGNIPHEVTTEQVNSKQHKISADNHDSHQGHAVGSHNLSSNKNENSAEDHVSYQEKPAGNHIVPLKKNEDTADNSYQSQRGSSDSATSKKNIDMEEVHAGAILFPGETGGGRDDIHGSSSDTDMDRARLDHSTTTKASVLTTTKAADDPDIERNLAKVKPNCPVVDRNNNCITDYS
nr:unnamed protein product [Callosobruchus analis]